MKYKEDASVSLSHRYDEDYYEHGVQSGKSLYTNYRWLPELTIPLAARICEVLLIPRGGRVLDFGCSKGYLVKALRLLGREAYGYDISEYALSKAPDDVKDFCFNNLESIPDELDWVVTKDVLEHVPETDLQKSLASIRAKSRNLFVVVPLGENGKYNIPDYELDVTHQIRRPLHWWIEQLKAADYPRVHATYQIPGIKDDWNSFDRGNGFFICLGES